MTREQSPDFIRKVVAAVFVTILLVLGFLLLGRGVGFFLVLFGAILVAVLLRASTNFLRDKLHVSDRAGLAISILVSLVILAGIIALVIPTVADQADKITEQLPEAWETLVSGVEQTSLGRVIITRVGSLELMPDDEQLVELAGNFFTGTIGAFADLLIILVIGIFLAASPRLYVQGVVVLVAPDRRDRVEEVMHQVYFTLKAWLLGKFLTMVFVGVVVGIGLAVLGVPGAFTLAFIAFLLDFIPNIGPLIAAAAAILLALLDSATTALLVTALYFVVQQVESLVLAPYMFKKTVSLSPVVTLASLILLGILAGAMGVIMATPLVAALQVIIRELYINDYLERDLEDGSENSFQSRMKKE